MDSALENRPPLIRVLVVDESPALRDTLRSFLEHAGYEVLAVGNAEDTLKALSQDSFDVLAMDPSVSEGSGEEILQYLGISLKKPPGKIILLSSGDSFGEDQNLRYLVTASLKKPLQLGELLRIIREP